jgi:hypothetical protein
MNIYFGGVGTDAGGWYIGPDGKIHRIPGWNPDAFVEVARAVRVVREGALLKTPGLAEATTRHALDFAQKELKHHLKDGGVLVLGG